MKFSGSTVRPYMAGVLAASVVGVAAATIAAPAATAAPCTAAGLASTVSSVTAAAGQYLEAHPDANDALTQAGSQPPEDAKASLRSYFFGHTDQYFALQRIAQPLNDLRAQCNSSVSVGQVAQLLDTLRD